MSADIFSLSQRARMPWQSAQFTIEQRAVLQSLAHIGIEKGAIRDYTFEAGRNSHTLHLINGKWEGAPAITFSKTLEAEGLRYSYSRSGGDFVVSDDFMHAVGCAQYDLERFGEIARKEMEEHARNITVLNRRAALKLIVS